MRRIDSLLLPLTILSLFLLSSCSKNETEDISQASKSIVAGECSAFSFTAGMSCTFNGVDKIDLALGKHGVLYCVKSDAAESAFKAWLNGSDNPECIVSDKATVNGESMQCVIDGLVPDTEYSYCLFLQKRDGTREISAVSTFRTKPFNPDLKEVVIKKVHCLVAFVECDFGIDKTDAVYCEMGVIVSEQPDGNVDNSALFWYNGSNNVTNTITLARLDSNKDYYCRLFLKYPVSLGSDYVYGPEATFKTKDYKDYEEVAVDLGLSSGLLWATHNVGAENPEDYGDYYAWGEVETYYVDGYAQENPQNHWKFGKENGYNYNSYKYCYAYNRLTKYCDDSSMGDNGFTDTKTVLDPEDDVAHVKWNGDWRMPTRAEFDELVENCVWTWTTLNGVNGYKVSGKNSGYEDNSIFLPAGGHYDDRNLVDKVSHGTYWSSSLNIGDPGYVFCAMTLSFRSDDFNTYRYGRRYGNSVRPVCP